MSVLPDPGPLTALLRWAKYKGEQKWSQFEIPNQL